MGELLVFVAGLIVGVAGGAAWGMRRRSPSIFRLGYGLGGVVGLAVGLGGGMRLGRSLGRSYQGKGESNGKR